jgi:hypothetical protein
MDAQQAGDPRDMPWASRIAGLTPAAQAVDRAMILWPEEPEPEPGEGYAWTRHVVTADEPPDRDTS